MSICTEELRKGRQAFALLFISALLTTGAAGVVKGEQATKSGGAKPTATGLHYYLARSISGVSCVAQVDFDEARAAEKYDALAKQTIETLDKMR